jgi:hypothetical protein
MGQNFTMRRVGETMQHDRFRAGDRVVVRSPEEILSTLDSDGTLEGLPFMPEMLDWCGKILRVERRATQTCVAVDPPEYHHRYFNSNDVVLLEDTRCSGASHDGCKRGCKVFWKEAWLRNADSADESNARSSVASENLRTRLKTKIDERYFCQSTELRRATVPFPSDRKWWRARVALMELRSGDRSFRELTAMFARWGYYRLLRRVRGYEWLRGPHDRITPTLSLGLERGDTVRVKSRAEIQATLDRAQRNRGLHVCYEMTSLFGKMTKIRDRVDQIIDEKTGQMHHLSSTVTLELGEGRCFCGQETGDCPRGELMYWREIWLERESVDEDVSSSLELERSALAGLSRDPDLLARPASRPLD